MMSTPPQLTRRQSELLDKQPLNSATRIVLLQDSNHCYLVESGEVIVYAARMRDGTPLYNRKEICTFTAGEFIFAGTSLPPDSLPLKPEVLEREKAEQLYLGCFMTVNGDDNLSLVDRKTLLHHSELVEHAIFATHNWASKILDALPKNTDLPMLPGLRISSAERQHITDKDICAQGDGDEMLWLQFDQAETMGDDASTTLASYRGLAVGDDNPIKQFQLPLFGRDIVIVHSDVMINISTTQQLLQQNIGIKILDDFDYLIRVLLYLHALRIEKKQQWSLARAKKVEQQNLKTMLQNFQNAFHGKEDIAPYNMVMDRTSINSNLILELCAVTETEIKVITPELLDSVDSATFSGMERLLSLGGFDKRRVTLEEKWYKKNAWTMVGFLQDQTPVLLHHKSKGYKYYDPKTNVWDTLSDSMAKQMDSEALLVYRRLNEQVTDLKGFVMQALQLAHVDVKRILMTALVLGALTLIYPVILGKLISQALPNFDFSLLNSYLLALFAAVLGIFIANFFNSIAMLRIESSLSLDMHTALWGRLLRLPMSFFNRHTVGDLSSRANIFDDLQAIWTSSTANAISSSLSLLFNLTLLFYYSWRLALIIVFAFLLFFILTWMICRKVLPMIANIFEYKGKIDGLIFQLIQGIAKLRVAAKENTALALWSNLYNKMTVENRRYMFVNNTLQVVANVIPLGGSILIFSFIFFGLLQAGFQENFSLGDFILFNAAFGQLTGTIISLSMVFLSVMSTIPMGKRMLPILAEPVEVSVQKAQLPSLRGNIRFSSVKFYYQQNNPILKDVSLKIQEGEYVAIVGHSGSGKSTLLKLLLGFEEAQEGAVFVDDANVNDIDLSDLRRQIGVVLQNGDILPGSIYENISCENINVTMEGAWEAAEKAGLKKDIEALPMGMHTLLSAFGGGGLSGGQLQRIMIARSIAHSPSILLLDEATSALDNITQKIVQDSLLQMNITRIVIAHRLTTISKVDRIYVLDQGKVAEHGSYEELLEKRGLFYELAIGQMQTE